MEEVCDWIYSSKQWYKLKKFVVYYKKQGTVKIFQYSIGVAHKGKK